MSKICTTNYEKICPVYQDIQDYLSFFVNPRAVPISVIVPTYIPPAIRYRFEGREPVLVEQGVRFELGEQTTFNIGNYNVFVNSNRRLYLGSNVWGNIVENRRYFIENGKFKRLQNPTENFLGGNFGQCLNFPNQALIFENALGQEVSLLVFTCISGLQWNFGNNEHTGWSVTSIEQLSGEPPTVICTITVYDKDDNILTVDSGEGCPETDTLTEACFYDPKNENAFATVFEATDTIYYNIRNNMQGNRKCTFITSSTLQLDIASSPKLELDFIESGAIYSICSEEGCNLAPLMCFECPPPPDEECEECPNGTSITILDGSNLLCVDSQGCVIATITYDPECHKPDCFC